MPNRTLLIALLALSAAACKSPEVPAEDAGMPMVQALPNIPLPPGGSPVSTERGGDAVQLLVSTPTPADTVLAFYRDLLSKPPYRLINEADNKGSTSFYVEQDGPPLWVTVEGLPAGGTMVRLAGAAIVDPTAKPDSAPPQPASPDSAKTE